MSGSASIVTSTLAQSSEKEYASTTMIDYSSIRGKVYYSDLTNLIVSKYELFKK